MPTHSLAGLKILFAGSGEFGVPTLRALAAAHANMVQVITQPDRPAGRGRELTPTPLAAAALSLGLPVLRTSDINRESPPDADVMVVIAFGQKIGQTLVNRPRLGSINLHASRLPRYRGAAPINWAILGGETVTGNSVIRLADRMDAGAILGQSLLEIGPTETAGELHDRLADDGPALVLQVLQQLAGGASIEVSQVDADATLAPKLSRQTGTLDFALPPDHTARLIRGLHPWPGCRVKLLDGAGSPISTLRLVRATVASADDAQRWEFGELTLDGFLRSGGGVVEILEIQPDGKKPMPLSDYRRGHRWLPGMRVVSVFE